MYYNFLVYSEITFKFACSLPRYNNNSLRASSPGALAAGQEKEGELAAWIQPQISCGSPLTELWDFHQSARSRNERKCKQRFIEKHKPIKGDDIITNVISNNQHFT